MFQILIVDQFRRSPGVPSSRLEIIAWVGGAFLGYFIYRRYSLQRDGAPWPFLWVFQIGRRL
jgi:hypothetical protein